MAFQLPEVSRGNMLEWALVPELIGLICSALYDHTTFHTDDKTLQTLVRLMRRTSKDVTAVCARMCAPIFGALKSRASALAFYVTHAATLELEDVTTTIYTDWQRRVLTFLTQPSVPEFVQKRLVFTGDHLPCDWSFVSEALAARVLRIAPWIHIHIIIMAARERAAVLGRIKERAGIKRLKNKKLIVNAWHNEKKYRPQEKPVDLLLSRDAAGNPVLRYSSVFFLYNDSCGYPGALNRFEMPKGLFVQSECWTEDGNCYKETTF